MDRKQVVLSAEETLRQRDFERKLADIHRQRSRAPLALVDTFGCQQNVADSQHIMGMLQAMGCEFCSKGPETLPNPQRPPAEKPPALSAAGTGFWKILLPWIPSVKQPGRCPG